MEDMWMLRTPRRHADHRQGESETRQAPYAAEAPAAPVRTPMRRPRIMPSSERIENTCLGSARRAVRCTAIGATNCRRARRRIYTRTQHKVRPVAHQRNTATRNAATPHPGTTTHKTDRITPKAGAPQHTRENPPESVCGPNSPR